MANYLADDVVIPQAIPEEGEGPRGTAGDFAKVLGAGTADVGSNIAASARYFFELGGSKNGADIAQGLQKIFTAGSDAITDTINPETKKLAAASMTSPEFWEHPILATALKTTGMVPMMAAIAIPGGLFADAVGATVFAAGAGGALNAGDVIEDFYKKLDAASDDELQKQSPKYKALREVMDEDQARKRFNKESLGWAPAINAVLGAATGVLGPAGVAARRLAGGAANVIGAGERGALGAAGVAAAEGVGTNALQEGVADITGQQAGIEAGFQKDLDLAKSANAALEGGVLGGILGGVAGGVLHKTPAASTTDKINRVLNEVDADASPARNEAVPQPQTGTTGAPSKPVESPQVGNPQNAPTRGDRDGAKPPPIPKAGEALAVTSASGPDLAQAAAIKAMDPAPQATATEVAAAKPPPVPVTPEVTPPPVPQEQAASPPLAPDAPLDTGVNVPEKPASLAEQIKQIGTGDRKAAMFPVGSPEAPKKAPKGLRKHVTPRGAFIYDPKLTNPREITKLSAAGRENELLGLGPVSKPEAVARVAAGETPVAVTERTPEGVEVKAAAGTPVTAPDQVRALERAKTPGNVVAVETPENVLQMRTGKEPPRTGRILPNLAVTAETTPLADFNANKVVDKTPKGKKYSAKEREKVDERLSAAEEIVGKHPGEVELERDYLTKPEARERVIERARTMLKEAEERGIKVNEKFQESVKGDAPSDNPNMLVLAEAKRLVKVADKHPQGLKRTEATGRFWERDQSVRKGYAKEVLAERRAEGDLNARRDQGDVEEKSEGMAGGSAGSARIGTASEKRTVKDKTGNEAEVTGVKAASGDKLAGADAAAKKAALIAEMNAKYSKGAPERAPVKKQAQQQQRPNHNPTEAQKVAGNYRMGHRTVEGLDLSLENLKGSTRRGKTEDGTPWAVKMVADYGYVKGTKGADGDHIDAYDLRTGKRHYVLDQLDHRTGEFDEHKLILRAKDEGHAIDTYDAGFSDGKGLDRVGHLHEVTAPEIKDWLDRGDTTKPHLEHLVRDMDAVNFDVPEGRNKVQVEGGPLIKVVRSSTAAAELAKFDYGSLPGVEGKLAKFFAHQISKIAGDVEVHYVTPEVMKSIVQGAREGQPASMGLHVYVADAHGRNSGKSQVFINNTVPDGVGLHTKGHTILHEVVHAITSREIDLVPGAKRMIEKLMRIADEHRQGDVEALLDGSLKYGFTNAKEFIAEAFSNPNFQKFLSQIPINDAELARHLNLHPRNMSAWDVFRGFVKKTIEKITGKVQNFDSVLDGIMRVGEHLTTIHAVDTPSVQGRTQRQQAMAPVERGVQQLDKLATDGVKRLLERRELQSPERAPFALKLRTFDNIAQIADHYFGDANPIRAIHNAIEAMRVTGERLFQQHEPLIKRLVSLRAANPEQFKEFSALLHDATVANVHPDVALTDAKNAHLGKKRIVGDAVWSKAQHADLSKRFNWLVSQNPEFKDAWHDVTKHYADTQNKMSLGIINNRILKLMGIEDEALGRRIHEGTLTDADKKLLGSNLEVIEAASELSKIEGPYVPLIRRGNFVVKGDYKVTRPGNAKEISPNEFEFGSEKEATSYAKSSDLKASVKKVWVDEATGELHQPDPVTGLPHKMAATDMDSAARYRVEVQNQHVEFHETRRAAEARRLELIADGLDAHQVVPRLYEPGGRAAIELSASLERLVSKLEKSEAYKQSTPLQKAALRSAVHEAAAASHGSTRIASKALPRRGVKGYSEDLVQNAADYGQSASRYLAKLGHMPDVEAGMAEMEARLKSDESKINQFGRTAIRNEVVQRVQGDVGFEQGGKYSAVVKRAMAISFIDKLGSPAYSVINAAQPMMVTGPVLAGRHGLARAVTFLGKAYSDVSALKVVGQGIAETGRRIKGATKPDDFITDIKGRLKSPEEKALLDELVKLGVIDPSAGMEIKELVRDRSGVGGKFDTGLAYLEGVTREMPRAIESINRTVTALAAYRLEKARGVSHESAVQYAQDVVNRTQFNYSPTNSPALFNHPLAKVALQFKKYGQGMYQLIGSEIGKAYRNSSPGDRSSAVKTLISLAGTHMAIAGALGLPTEPFKYLVMGTGLVTGKQWGDVENQIRQSAASVFGKTGGEVFSRGLPRLLNLDLSRMGLDSVTSFGEPRSQKEADVKTWLFDSLAGPVASLGGDWVKGVNNIINGNFEKAAEQMIPLKAASDSLRAYRQATEGKKSATGKATSAPYSATEAGMRALGFGTGREAEEGARASAYYRQSNAAKENRQALMTAWVQAPPNDKGKAMGTITKFNQGLPEDEKITMKELTSLAKRRDKDAKAAVQGINPGKRDKRFLAEGEIYNTQ